MYVNFIHELHERVTELLMDLVGMGLASIRFGEHDRTYGEPDGGKPHPYYNVME